MKDLFIGSVAIDSLLGTLVLYNTITCFNSLKSLVRRLPLLILTESVSYKLPSSLNINTLSLFKNISKSIPISYLLKLDTV